MRAADAWCATPIFVSDSAALCASVGVFAASRPQDGQEPKAGAGKALTALRYRPECPWPQAQRVSQYCTLSNFCTVPHCGTDYMV